MQTKPTCRAIRDRLTLYLMGDLDPQTQETIANHLTECEACRVVAEKLEPTLSQLRDALQEQVAEAPTSLSPEHRQRVLAAFRERKQSKRPAKRRKPLLLRFHVLEMAAVFVAGLMIVGFLMPATFKAERKAKLLSVAMTEPEPMEELEEIESPFAGDESEFMGEGFVVEVTDLVDNGAFGDNFEATEDSSVRLSEVADVKFDDVDNDVAFTYRAAEGKSGASVNTQPNLDRGSMVSEKRYKSGARAAIAMPSATGSATRHSEYSLDAAATFDNKKNTYAYYDTPPETADIELQEPPVMANSGYTVTAPAPASRQEPVKPRKQKRPLQPKGVFTKTKGDAVGGRGAVSGKVGASVTPADFDSVAMVKSPVVMNRILGSRSPGIEGETKALRGAEWSADDIPADIVDYNGRGDVGGDVTLRADVYAPSATGPAKKADRREWRQNRDELPSRNMGDKRSQKDSLRERQSVAKENLEQKALHDVTTPSLMEASDGSTMTINGAMSIVAGWEDKSGRSTMTLGGDKDENVPGFMGEKSQMLFKAAPPAEEDGIEQIVSKSEDIEEDDFEITRIASKVEAVPAPVQQKPEVSADDGVNDPFAPRFQATGVNPFVAVSAKPFSTFSIDVDTASYTLSRNYMLGGHLPPAEAVRTEEFVNFFDYAYQPPVSRTFRVASEIAPSRFARGKHLLKLGVKGRRLGREEQRQASLTLLIDSSGSMNQPDRLGLVRTALEMLLNELAETDQVAIIQFDNRARLILAHTPVRDRETILKAIDAIQCGGGTNLETGLQQAYDQAAKAFISRGENRILLLSDGVVNLGETATESITTRIEANRRQGLYLSVFGFGMGIYDDTMLKALATKGNGAYAFIDSETEARRIFVDDLSATLNTIAEDVKIQIEFNPLLVDEYRQLGYESRQLTKEQFRDDTVNAGEVGSGQSVTALYELDLADMPVPYAAQSRSVRAPEFDNWIAVARVRYRRVDNGKIEEIEQRITAADVLPSFAAASNRFRLAAGVAAFAEILRGSPFAKGVQFDDVASVLRPVSLDLHLDQRIRELVQIVETAGGLTR